MFKKSKSGKTDVGDNVMPMPTLPARGSIEAPPAPGVAFNNDASEIAAMLREIDELRDPDSVVTKLAMDELDTLEWPEADVDGAPSEEPAAAPKPDATSNEPGDSGPLST